MVRSNLANACLIMQAYSCLLMEKYKLQRLSLLKLTISKRNWQCFAMVCIVFDQEYDKRGSVSVKK